ncbi:helix-turn-helix domain-containing protein [Roseateles sp. PN1]|uniref:helix-turn-helix domain-containing protein n=1 Tax=Roseateles sp. PN1 TaxID=3137372 RepID=UPI0031399963
MGRQIGGLHMHCLHIGLLALRWNRGSHMLKSIHSRQNNLFLQLLRERRKGKRLRQTDLADRLGRGQAVVSRVERGARRLDVVELWAWLAALECDFLAFATELDQRLKTCPAPNVRIGAILKRSPNANSTARANVGEPSDGPSSPSTAQQLP